MTSSTSGRVLSGVLGLMVAICGALGEAMAYTFTGDPAADHWDFVGDSNAEDFYVRGLTSFKIYKTTFLLGPTDSVSSTSFPQGDAYLFNGNEDSWKIGDRILGFGISDWSGLQEGGWPSQTGSSGISYLKFDPEGTGVFGNASSGKINNDGSIYQSPGSFGFDINRNTQNSSTQSSPPFQTYQDFELQKAIACPADGPCSHTFQPYGSLISADNNRSTTAGGSATLPMRIFGIKGSTEFSWRSFEFFINTSLLPDGVGRFGDNSMFDFSTHSADFGSTESAVTCEGATTVLLASCDFVAAAGDLGPLEWPTAQTLVSAPGPSPLFGLGAALIYSRRLQKRLKSKGNISPTVLTCQGIKE